MDALDASFGICLLDHYKINCYSCLDCKVPNAVVLGSVGFVILGVYHYIYYIWFRVYLYNRDEFFFTELSNEASTAVEIQQSAAAMVKESGGAASALTRRIASAGKGGRYRGNISRDIRRALQLPLVACC